MRKVLHLVVVAFLGGCSRVPTELTTTSTGDADGGSRPATGHTNDAGGTIADAGAPTDGGTIATDAGATDGGLTNDGGTPLGWTAVPNPGGDYNAVWAAAPDDVWFGPPMTHWYHGTFTQYPDIEPVQLLSGTGAADVYAHGMHTIDVGGEERPWGSVSHWDGVAWTKQSDTRPPIDIWARTPSDLYVNGGGPMWRSTDQGRTWSDVVVPDPCGGTDAFAGSGLQLVAIGASCTAGDAYLRWSRDGGATWSVGHAPLDHARTIGVRGNTAYVEGYKFVANGNAVEQFLRTDDGVTFRPIDVSIIVDRMWLDSPDDIWIASEYPAGLQHSRDGGKTWTVERPELIRAIYAVGAHDLLAVGPGSTLLHLSR